MLRVKLKKGIPSLSVRRGVDSLLMVADQEYTIKENLYSKCISMVDVVSNKWRILKKKRLAIYLPDGIGDIHWVFCKLKSLMDQCGALELELFIRLVSGRPKRSRAFAEGFPGVVSVTYVNTLIPFPSEGYWVEYGGYDYCLDATAYLARGKKLEDWLSLDYNPNYIKDRFKRSPRFKGEVVVSLLDKIANSNWGGSWDDQHWCRVISAIVKSGRMVNLVGLDCDRLRANQVLEKLDSNVIDYVKDQVGSTNFKQCMNIALGCDLVLGLCSGLTILSAACEVPTVIGWPGKEASSKLNQAFWYAGINSDKYRPITTDSTAKELLLEVVKVWRKQ